MAKIVRKLDPNSETPLASYSGRKNEKIKNDFSKTVIKDPLAGNEEKEFFVEKILDKRIGKKYVLKILYLKSSPLKTGSKKHSGPENIKKSRPKKKTS